MAKKDEAIVVQIAKLEKKVVHVKLIGDTPLIMHSWSEKAKKQMLDAQQGKKKGKAKEYRNPVREFIDSMYWLSHKPILADDASEEECERAFEAAIEAGATFGFPCSAFKMAGNSTAYRANWVKNQMGLRAASRVKADPNAAAAQFEQLEQTVGLTQQTVLDANRPADAPLHNEFEWDDTEAAEKYRLHQAGHLIRSLVIVPECEEPQSDKAEKPVQVRAYFPIQGTYQQTAQLENGAAARLF